MTTNALNKPPTWFWVVAVIALLWNLMGVSAYLFEAFTSIEQLEQMTQEQRALFEGRPAWVTAAYAIAVFAGAIGSIALLIRKKWAKPLLVVSLIAAIAQFIYNSFMTNTIEVMGTQAIIFPILILGFGLYLIFFAKKSITKGWLT
ncbi:hypothetical protein [uncultured Croceitalea sp.]|uniref:hypothetical protein n=1 Tax=uncultured Croceitalea sp. TaxID=1798908 RepID=UPI00374EABBE